MPPHRDMSLTMDMLDMAMDTTLARGLPMLMLMPTTVTLMLMLLFPSAQALVLTQSLRVLMLPLRDMPLTMLGMLAMAMVDTMVTTWARGLLMLMLMFPSAQALVLTQSPRVLMLPLRDMPLTMLGMLAMAMVDTMVTTWARGLLMLMLMPTTVTL